MGLVLVILFGVFLGTSIRAKKSNRPVALHRIIWITSLVLLVLFIGRYIWLRYQDMAVSDRLLQKMSAIPWDDDEYLYSIGFAQEEEGIVYEHFIRPNGVLDGTNIHILVETADEEQVKTQHKFKEKDSIQYVCYSIPYYNSTLHRWLFSVDTVERHYYFYTKGRLISVYETNYANTEKLFEQHMLEWPECPDNDL